MAESKKPLKLLDATLIVASGMIGSGIFVVASDIGRTVGAPGWLLVAWAISGLMTIFAALSYGELAGMFPAAGGQYVYLKEAYNPFVAFLYGWSLFAIVQTGTIAAVAVAFAKYVGVLHESFGDKHILMQWGTFKISAAQVLGIMLIIALTAINSLGINYGKLINRIFTSTKLLALFGLILLGLFFFAKPEIWQNNTAHFWDTVTWQKDAAGTWSSSSLSGIGIMAAIGVALVGSLFSSDAWNNVTFIAGEIDQPKRNIPLSLFIGTGIVVTIYMLANVAYLKLLPFYGDPNGQDVISRGLQFAEYDRVGSAAATMIFGGTGTVVMAVLIMISTFGCNNGIILASVRVYQTMAKDKLFFERMKHNNSNGVPGIALWIQCLWASLLCLSGSYGDLLDYVMFAVMLFYILTIAGIFILRKKMPDAERPYKAFGYPVIPAIYIVLASAFCINLLVMKWTNAAMGLAIVAAGIPIYYYWSAQQAKKA
ncbi:MAG: amino acid permease [Chitinophagales bacterium]